MKSFREYLEESQNALGGAGLSSNKIPYDIQDPSVKNAIKNFKVHDFCVQLISYYLLYYSYDKYLLLKNYKVFFENIL